MAKSALLANINFLKKLSPDDKEVIKNILQFKPEEGKYGVCTSLEERAFLILKRMFMHAYNADEESETHWNRSSNMRPTFFIKHWLYERWQALTSNVSCWIFEYKHKPVQLHAKKWVGAECQQIENQLDRKMNDNKKNSEKNMGYMKNLFNAASSLTALGNTFDKKVQ